MNLLMTNMNTPAHHLACCNPDVCSLALADSGGGVCIYLDKEFTYHHCFFKRETHPGIQILPFIKSERGVM